MREIKCLRMGFLLIPFAIALMSTLPGCGDSPSDLDRANSGVPLKTPSEVLKEAKAKAAAADQAPAPGGTETQAPK